ncbi:MAG: dynamin family protein, partial [Magnetococcales bacterium]|nr:dynamin family protein [Magnetococcales bacterium]
SFTTRVPWWPLISIMGTFSSGKSSFINSFLEQKIQRTGNQAVDDKFTVICFSKEEESRTLPGLALDSDPRFPFYQISRQIEQVVSGEGRRIDAYLQLKTTASEKLRGKILIDSPGFDADDQRNATLKISDHIMDLSDLVLVFFDARHPEPGAMKDTLEHLVANTISRPDSNKFLFVLNQVDCTVQEDNLEDVVAAWQRALSQAGLMAGRFYQIYNIDSASPIANEALKNRYEGKRREDMEEITDRIRRVEVERAYRIIGVLEHTAKLILDQAIGKLTDLIGRWRKKLLLLDTIGLGIAALLTLGVVRSFNLDLSHLNPALWPAMNQTQTLVHGISLGVALILLWAGHLQLLRPLAGWMVTRNLSKEIRDADLLELVSKGFAKSTRDPLFVLFNSPAGWSGQAEKTILRVLKDADSYIQGLNDQFTNPSGRQDTPNPTIPHHDTV